jgi:hypothetical protein
MPIKQNKCLRVSSRLRPAGAAQYNATSQLCELTCKSDSQPFDASNPKTWATVNAGVCNSTFYSADILYCANVPSLLNNQYSWFAKELTNQHT